MKTFLIRFLSVLLLAISRGESRCFVDALLPRKCVREDYHKTHGFSSWKLPSRGGGVLRTPVAQKLLPFTLNQNRRQFSETAVATASGPAIPFETPKFQKSREKESFIEGVLQANFLFHDISASGTNGENSEAKKKSNLSEVVAAFEEVDFPVGSCICKQGDLDDIDYLYIVYEGYCSISIDGKQLVEPYGVMRHGSVVGDMALIYDAPRAATVKATTPVKAFRLHRDAFNYFLESKSTNDKISPKEKIRRDLKKIDNVIDQIAGLKSKYDGDIIPQFKPERSWLWRQWKGTILEQAWKSAACNMLLSVFIIILFRFICNDIINCPITWPIGRIPDKSHFLVSRILGLSKLWNTVLGLVTFVLTFFLSQSYSLWKSIYGKGREIQGNLNDLSLMAASRAKRDPETNQYTPESSVVLNDIASYIRIFNVLAWASLARKFGVLLTPKGMSRMLSRGVMTRKQYDILVNLPPNASAPETVLQWILVRLMKGIDDGVFPRTETVEDVFTGRTLNLRGLLAQIRLSLLGKIPLAYAHFVQFLVDFFLFLAPFALYPELGFWSIPAVGLLNIFYGGLLDLSKILLFPLENDDSSFTENTTVNMDVGVLIRESNVGSNRFKRAINKLPF